MSNPDEFGTLRLRPRPSEAVTLSIPTDTLELVRRVAATRDMSPDALLRFYVGQGLRHDAARLFSERIMQTTGGGPGAPHPLGRGAIRHPSRDPGRGRVS